MTMLGYAPPEAQEKIKETQAEKDKRLRATGRKRNREELIRLKKKFLPLPTMQPFTESEEMNITLSDFETDGREVLDCYEFIPTNLLYLTGFLVFYYDGTSEVVIKAYSWEDLSYPLLKEIQRWEFFDSPFKIKDEAYNYPLFFSPRGTSVALEKTDSFEKGFKLVSKYFHWIYTDKVPQEQDIFSDYRLVVENFLKE